MYSHWAWLQAWSGVQRLDKPEDLAPPEPDDWHLLSTLQVRPCSLQHFPAATWDPVKRTMQEDSIAPRPGGIMCSDAWHIPMPA